MQAKDPPGFEARVRSHQNPKQGFEDPHKRTYVQTDFIFQKSRQSRQFKADIKGLYIFRFINWFAF